MVRFLKGLWKGAGNPDDNRDVHWNAPPGRPGESALNDAIRSKMADAGEDLEAYRRVDHFLSSGEGAAPKAALIDQVSTAGFQVETNGKADTLRLVHEMPLASPLFDAVTAKLLSICDQNGWRYDGWECGPALEEGQG